MKKIASIIILLATLCNSCMNEHDADNVVLFVTPSTLEANGGEKIYFDIWSQTLNQQLVLFELETFDSVNGLTPVYSTEPNQKEYTYRLVFDVPNIDAEQCDLELIFSAKDNLGYEQSITLHLTVIGADETADELTGITLYSPFSDKEDAFSFRLMQKIKASESKDEDIDLYVIAGSQEPTILSHSWGSKTGMRFCKVNSFNYAGATKQSIAATYGSSVTATVVSDLSIDDIILVGDETKAVAAIRIVNIYDEDGYAQDRYDINLKVITTSEEEDSDATKPEDNTQTDASTETDEESEKEEEK